jgi:hypothetical protein
MKKYILLCLLLSICACVTQTVTITDLDPSGPHEYSTTLEDTYVGPWSSVNLQDSQKTKLHTPYKYTSRPRFKPVPDTNSTK